MDKDYEWMWTEFDEYELDFIADELDEDDLPFPIDIDLD